MQVVNLAEKFAKFKERWSPKIAGEINDFYVKLVKIEGEFVWHSHEHEDELFLVLVGELRMRFRNREELVSPGEFIIVQATGLGVPVLDDNNSPLIQTGVQYPQNGPVTTPGSFVSAIAGGSTADVISATLQPGTVGTFEVILHLNAGIATNPTTTLTIAQDIYVSRVVTFPVVNPAAPSQ